MMDIWQLGFVLHGERTIDRRCSVHEVFSQESAFVHARDEVNSTAGVQCAGGSSASFSFLSSPKKMMPAKITYPTVLKVKIILKFYLCSTVSL